MADLWLTLLPLAVGSAVVPVHVLVTILLLRRASGRLAAAAWIAGMTATRLIQGLLFGFIVVPVEREDPAAATVIVDIVLLVIAVVLLAMAGRALVKVPDDDAPPPRWMTALDGVGPARAFGLGALVVAIGPKFWVFTLGAIAAIGETTLAAGPAIAAFLGFVLIATSIHLVLWLTTVAAPRRAEATLGRLYDALTTYGRPIKVGLGTVFGLWFLLQALSGLGVW